jgi:hypothetical protein
VTIWTYYEHVPERVIYINDTTTMWDVPVITDRTILANWLDTVLRDKEKKTCLLFDIAVRDESNGNTKEAKKLEVYEDLEIKVSSMWESEDRNCASYNWSIRNN